MWIDSHCHLDAPEFDADRADVVRAARDAGVTQLVIPAVQVANFDAVRQLAREHGFAYALGIHPLYVDRAADDDVDRLHDSLVQCRDDPLLVAVGEIGLDHFVPGLDRDRQQRFYLAQLKLARAFGLPVILHVRRSADTLLAGLRRVPVAGGIAHAFNGSAVQAGQFVDRGFCLGFGGTLTFDRALQIRRLAATVPATALALETDAPDIPPHWLYRRAADRVADRVGDLAGDITGPATSRNTPAELPRIAQSLADLRGWPLAELARVTTGNVRRVLPQLARAHAAP